MKFLLFIVVLLIGVWLWRSGRPAIGRAKPQPTTPPPPLDMVSCARCGVHVPQAEVVQGHAGVYCSADHRQQAEP